RGKRSAAVQRGSLPREERVGDRRASPTATGALEPRSGDRGTAAWRPGGDRAPDEWPRGHEQSPPDPGQRKLGRGSGSARDHGWPPSTRAADPLVLARARTDRNFERGLIA